MFSILGWGKLPIRFVGGGIGVKKTARILHIGEHQHGDPATDSGGAEIVYVQNATEAIRELAAVPYDELRLSGTAIQQGIDLLVNRRSDEMLRDMPDGVALVDDRRVVLWANRRLEKWSECESLVGIDFYEGLANPEIMGPDFCPFHTALATGQPSGMTLRTIDNRFFQVHAAPLVEGERAHQLVVTVSDITEEILQQQKLAAIHLAGRQLADLRPDEIFLMDVDQRIDLLKENIRHYLSDLLNFDVIEIRLLEQATGYLMPLLSVGIDQEAADRQLFAQPNGNGVTGYVAATGNSYLCEDVGNDPLYIPGAAGAKSSLTVPLMLHDQVLGTINVESPEPRAFSSSDIQFLEIFARDVAHALNTLELLVAQKANTAQQSCEAIHSAVAMPVDEILNDAVNVMEGYIGHQSEMVDRLRRILQNARDIKQMIQQVGQTMTPLDAVPAGIKTPQRTMLEGRRILVVDTDEQVRNDAHQLLERYGCIVETAHTGSESVLMVRGSDACRYDVIISDIRLPDFSGYQLMCRLQQFMNPVPMVLMTGFGYDPGHSIVKARQAGLHPKAILYKPFRLDQLIEVVETIVQNYQPQHA
jgi:CheY-like chemotaxis protein